MRSALDILVERFGLSPFERDVLLLCAGIELDSGFAAVCAAAQGDPAKAYPSFSLALAAFPEAHWSALGPGRPLRYWRLIEVGGTSLTASPLRIDERILHYLAGVDQPDERLAGLVRPLEAAGDLVPSQAELARRAARVLAEAAERGPLPAVVLCGADPAAQRELAAAVAAELGMRASILPAAAVPGSPAELDGLLRLWEREAVLGGCALLLDAWDLEGDTAREAAVGRLIDDLRGVLFISTRERRRARSRPLATFDVPGPTAAEQRMLWQTVLGPEVAAGLDGRLDDVVSQFQLGSAAIRSAGAQAVAVDDPGRALWDACRAQSRPRLDDLAQRIEPRAEWDDLVLPGYQKQILREMVVHVRRRQKVYEEWGFAARSARGLGISALFAGPSGTGKTLAAEVLAGVLRLDLYRIDLATVVSKYIGETEKNLRRIFDAAEEGGAILLFDEADALFGQRSEVKDSHDRYANIEVSYLLQRMESYRGLAILTTNLKDSLDQAFLRRLRFIVQFPFPDVGERAEIWRRAFPPQTPTQGLDPSKLARLSVTGGNIRNIALAAAFLAADDGGPVGMGHLLRAARGELSKLERPLSESEIRGWIE
ncbi:MAG TPA: ATP-binding protein [Thermoanaerobaculia bacterium]|nr:ATP-binding protein [Thermoanaerobaculia bacterium]